MKGQFTMLRCAIAGVEAVEARTRHTFSRHTHERFGIGVIYHGAQKSQSGRGMVEAGAGDTITVNPGEVHDGAPIGDTGRSWRILYFDPALIADTVRDMSEGRTKTFEFSYPVIQNASIARRFQQLFYSMTTDNTAGTVLLREESLLMLLADVMREQNDSCGAQSIPDSILKAQSLIDDDPASPVALCDLARESGLSRFQVLRGFAKATGFTPHAYQIQRRIHLARRLIAQGMPLAEAAAASGFADQSHMTRIFVRKYGVSPRAYADAVA
jgi:AraC-like DNA-binding protein